MIILKSFIFGVTIGIVIGPIAILIIQKSMTVGLRAAVPSCFGAALADGIYAVAAFLASGSLIHFLVGHQSRIVMISSWILILFGLFVFLDVFRKKNRPTSGELKSLIKDKSHFIQVFLLTLSNPLTIVLFVGFAGQTIERLQFPEAIICSLAILAGSLLSQFSLALMGFWFGQVVKRWNMTLYFNLISGCVIAGFGLFQLLK